MSGRHPTWKIVRSACAARLWSTGATLALALAGAACGERGGRNAPRSQAAQSGGTAVVCSQAAPERLDAFITPDQFAADLRLVLFTPLVEYDGRGGFRPGLASSWTWSADHRALTLQLRRDVRWHDGTPLTAGDVAWTVQRAADPDWGYWNQPDFATLAGAAALGDSAVELRFKEPLAAGLEPIAGLTVLPRHLLGSLTAAGFRDAPYHRAPVGSGPFRLAERRSDGALVLERFAGYPAALGAPRLQRLVLRVIQEPATILTELRTGGVDLCVGGSGLAAQAAAARGTLSVLPLEPSGVQAIPLNTRVPPLGDARVRLALSAALRRVDIAAAVSPLARPRRTFFPFSSPYADTAIGEPDADAARAAALFDSAGFARMGPDGIRRDATGRPLRLELLAPQQLQPALEVVQAQLRRAGVDVQLRFMEWATYLTTIRRPATRPAAMAVALYPDRLVDPDYQDNYASDGGSNLPSYANAAVDTLIRALRVTLAPERRRALYRDLQRRITADAPVLYLLASPRAVVVAPRLRDVRVDVNGPFADLESWWIPASERRGR